MKEDTENFSKFEPQPDKEKRYEVQSSVALKTCRIELDSAIVDLVEGCEIHGLTRQERDHLRFHGLID